MPVLGIPGASGRHLVLPVVTPTDTGAETASVDSARPRKSSVAPGRPEIGKVFFNPLVTRLPKM